MSKKTILYCHGFASSGTGPKSLALREAFGDENVIAPDLPIDPIAVEKLLDSIVTTTIEKGDSIVIVGTSLGGFWANYIGTKWLIPCVVINPALHPSTTLSPRVGATTYNFATGDLVTVTEEDIAEYASRETAETLTSRPELKTLFVAEDDDVINYAVALNELAAGTVITTVDGGHRFEKYWPNVVSKLNEILAS